MTTEALAATAAKLKTLPRVALPITVKMLTSPGEERVHMRRRLQRIYDRHGIAAAQHLGIFNMVHLFGPDANRFVLLDKDRIFSARKPWMTIMGRIFPNGLLLMDGEEHKLNRKIMHTAFTRPALRGYAERMQPMIAAGIAGWARDAGGERPFLVFPAVKELTLAMAASIFVGVELGPETKRMNAAFEDLVAASMSKIRLPIPGLEFQRGLRARKFMVDFFRGMIAAKRAGDTPDIFARLTRTVTDEGEKFADQQIVDHMTFLMMAAHDTTTSSLSSMFYELAVHPEWQERVRQECLSIGDAPGFDDLERFEITGRVMKETLRRYPPLPVIPRIAESETEFAGYRIPRGSMCTVSPIFTHHMPEWWDEPHRFDPDRFSPGRAEDERHSHSYIPFGGGPHMCIGLRFAEAQIKLVMHQVVRRYRWSVPPGYEMPVQQAPISKPMDGLPVRLERIG